MAMIKVEDLTFSYPGSFDNVFEHVSFQIDTNWKLGFVGRNGRGKTTFLNLLLGKYEHNGKIIANTKFDYFPYEIQDEKKSVREILRSICPMAEEWEIVREFNYLKVKDDVLECLFGTLSNGERTKIMLAALFLNEGHFLLIDEPTNHLDTEGRKLVSEYLKRKRGYILVSHDRDFIDGCVDHILSINRTNIEIQSGNFSSWMENFKRQQDFEQNKNERLKKEIGRLQQASKRTANWSDNVEATKYGSKNSGSKIDKGYVGHKSAKMMKNSKNIEARQQKAITEKSGLLKDLEISEDLKIQPMIYHSDRLASFSNVTINYGNQYICSNLNFEVRQGDRIALDGGNGSGKSSLIKLLVGEDISYSGTVTLASGVIISYVSQDTSNLYGTLTEYARQFQIDESLFKAVLRKMDFERIQFEKDISEFSEGQKKKVMLARSLCEKAHLYIWDEPLNFIDVYTRMQIEQLIMEFLPTMIFVEHDCRFQDLISTDKVKL